MKRLGVFLLPPGWDASPSQGYPQHFCRYPFIYLGGERHRESKVSCPRTHSTQCPRPGPEPVPLDPESSALTMRPLHPSHASFVMVYKCRTIFDFFAFTVSLFAFTKSQTFCNSMLTTLSSDFKSLSASSRFVSSANK